MFTTIYPLSSGFNPFLDELRNRPGNFRDCLLAGGALVGGAFSSAQPTSSAHTALAGSRETGFADDWYFRIHVTPNDLDLGNVVSEQVTTVSVWNGYLQPQTLRDIQSVNADGVDLTGQTNPPIDFRPLEELGWQVAVLPEGPATIDAEIDWEFVGLPPAPLKLKGSRITAWSWAPDWEQGVTEHIQFATEILRSQSGIEQRRAWRDLPLRSWDFEIRANERDRALLDLTWFSWGAQNWALPIWPDVQWIKGLDAQTTEVPCDTQYRDFEVGSLAMLLGDDAGTYEIMEVTDVQADRILVKTPLQGDWNGIARLYPVRIARLSDQPQLTRQTNTLMRGQVQFDLISPTAWPAEMPAQTYRGYPVLEQRPDESQDLTLAFARLVQQLDNGITAPALRDTAGIALPLQGHRWVLDGAAERSAFRSLIYALRGQQAPLWVPTWMDDMTLVTSMPAQSDHLDIANINYSRYAAGLVGRRDIRIELNDGTVRYAHITGATQVDAKTERLGLDAPIDVALDVDQVRRISWMALMRGNSDSIELSHETDIEGIATAQLVFRGVLDEEAS